MTATKEQILNQARKWLGYSEANGKFKEIIDVYNSHKPLARGYKLKYSDEWCDGFVSACAIACGAVDIIGTEVGVERHVDIFKKKGIWLGKIGSPKAGDIIVFDWDANSWGDHIGFVESVSGGAIITIEGNYGEKVTRRTINKGHYQIKGFARPKYKTSSNTESEKHETATKPSPTKDASVDVYYRVKTKDHGWLPEVKNLNDYAGYKNSPIVGVAMRVSKGSVKYRVHIKGKGWLGWISKYDINNKQTGWAGNNGIIDAIQIYYYTPDNVRPFKRAKYKVNNFDWQYDDETSNGQDGYAGLFGTNMTKFQIEIK